MGSEPTRGKLKGFLGNFEPKIIEIHHFSSVLFMRDSWGYPDQSWRDSSDFFNEIYINVGKQYQSFQSSIYR